ncbi:DUF4168 domain-containing protein [Lutimaribacter sp. EGI FJ00015]|uniref:DUF4168 domain-containing protein n=1 Tax=Lutimaribacter degradans TaxID=2945989 RepID=A0ACC6A151_9RHOB|nr:DUF4168 domain-containing protein [Lutimaribacter sp. EGI FJ00013]MCM2563484.1 DUF4168 domain-containing protein [Lutimaribacter sp. EGI FJ00013]MCO0614664.1 DUF4168 domain-containing protein [Lutimaribacter sp. EGI FJ00015]MCO0637334.1 DUF4168 domain-containing protein [Lutimaribacter sp. EGI FJ00014]
MTFKPKLTAALTAIALGFAAPAAIAQQGQQPTMAAEDVTQDQVDSFVEAALAVDNVRESYLPQIEAAEDEETRQNLLDEANSAALEAVESVDGLTSDDYLAIAAAAQQDQDLNARIVASLQAAQTE